MSGKDLSGRVAIVTGGGGGMGRAMALALVEAGARVAVLDVANNRAEAVADEARAIGDGESAIPLARDVSRAADCESAVRDTLDAFNSVDILVNCAGIGMRTMSPDYWKDPVLFWKADIDRFQALMDVNWRGAFIMAKMAAPVMIENGWGRIVNVTTSFDTMCLRGYTPYGPSKAALEAATSAWAKDLDGTGVTANVLVPGGPVNTDFIAEDTPFDRARLIQPGVMAAPIVWLASTASDGVTDRRFIAHDWDPDLPPDEAAEKAGGPCAWPNVGKKAYRPDRADA